MPFFTAGPFCIFITGFVAILINQERWSQRRDASPEKMSVWLAFFRVAISRLVWDNETSLKLILGPLKDQISSENGRSVQKVRS